MNLSANERQPGGSSRFEAERRLPWIGVQGGNRASAPNPRRTAGRRLGLILVSVLGVLLMDACHRQRGTVLGKAPRGDTKTVLAVKAGDTPPQVTLSGVMTEKCPVAGCWFRLKDRTGTIKVDTKSAGFVVLDVPTGQPVTVAGKVVADGNEVALEASGLRY